MSTTYTRAERRRQAVLLMRGSRQALADNVNPRLDAELDRIDRSAADRWDREATAALRLVEQAKNALAAAKATERAARRGERPAARTARKRAEQRVRDTENAARKYH